MTLTPAQSAGPLLGTGTEVPPGLEGVVVAETALGGVRPAEGFHHYRQYSALELARHRHLEDVWHLLVHGDLPDPTTRRRWAAHLAELRQLPPGLADALGALAKGGAPLEVLRSAISLLGAELGWRPTHDLDEDELAAEADRLCAVVPTILAAAWHQRRGASPVAPRADLPATANLLWMLTGHLPDAEAARAVEQYQILTVDHGLNASTFTARVIASTGADLASAVCGALGALSGPLHGGAPSRVLDLLDAVGRPEDAPAQLRAMLARGERLMGFGHRVYRSDDPRSAFLREVAAGLAGARFELAAAVEAAGLQALAAARPDRRLCTNVELYAAVVLEACGVDRALFTPTFAAARVIGWCAHVLEQARRNRLIRPASRYVGPPPPVPVPAG